MKTIQLIVFSLILISPICLAKSGPNSVVATVNDIKITKKELDESYKQNMLLITRQKITKEKVLKDMINRALGIQRAKKAKLAKDKVVKQKMEDVLYHAQVSKDLEPLLKKIVVTDNDVKNYYKKNREFRTAHILFRTRAIPSVKENRAAEAQALKIYKEIVKNKKKFPELANKYSQSSTAPNGGDMGFQPQARLAPEFAKAINGQKTGFISKPIRTQFGYHIIKIMDVKAYKNISMPLYKKIVYDIKRDSILNKYFSDLRKGASIKIDKKILN